VLCHDDPPLFYILRLDWWWFRSERFKARLMWVVAVDTQSVGFLPVPLTCATAVDPGFPIPENCAVALAAEVIGFFETHKPAACQPQDIPVIRVMTIQTPSFFLIVVYDLDLFMHILQNPLLEINFLVIMAVRTRKNILRKGRRRHKKLRYACFL
jgi:hypothetical protein